MITIKHRFTNATLCEFDVATVKEAAEKSKANLRGANLECTNLRGADLEGADLYGANLYGANLSGVNLRGADLYGTNLRGTDLEGANLEGTNLRGTDLRGANLYGANMYGANLEGEKITRNPLVLVGLRYWGLITDGFMRLGCQRHTHDEWGAFTDEQIYGMDGQTALDFWRQWKEPLLAMCRTYAPKQEGDE